MLGLVSISTPTGLKSCYRYGFPACETLNRKHHLRFTLKFRANFGSCVWVVNARSSVRILGMFFKDVRFSLRMSVGSGLFHSQC